MFFESAKIKIAGVATFYIESSTFYFSVISECPVFRDFETHTVVQMFNSNVSNTANVTNAIETSRKFINSLVF